MERIIRREGQKVEKEQIARSEDYIQAAYNSDGRLTMQYSSDYLAIEIWELLQLGKKLAMTRKETDEIPF